MPTLSTQATQVFKSTGVREVEVRVRKKRGKEIFRKMIIPDEIKRTHIVDLLSKYSVSMFAMRRYGFNTHSLRYTFITYLAQLGVSPQLIAKITKHSRLDMLLDYTQEKMADERVNEMMGENINIQAVNNKKPT